MKVELVQVSSQDIRKEAEQLATRYGFESPEAMWKAVDSGKYAGKFIEWEMKDLRDVLRLCEPAAAAE